MLTRGPCTLSICPAFRSAAISASARAQRSALRGGAAMGGNGAPTTVAASGAVKAGKTADGAAETAM